MFTAGAATAGEPVFDRPLTRAGPPHDYFGRLMSRSQFALQGISNGPGIRSKILRVWKNYALFRQHFAGPSVAFSEFATQRDLDGGRMPGLPGPDRGSFSGTGVCCQP